MLHEYCNFLEIWKNREINNFNAGGKQVHGNDQQICKVQRSYSGR